MVPTASLAVDEIFPFALRVATVDHVLGVFGSIRRGLELLGYLALPLGLALLPAQRRRV